MATSSPHDPAELGSGPQTALDNRAVSGQNGAGMARRDHRQICRERRVGIQEMACRALPYSPNLASTLRPGSTEGELSQESLVEVASEPLLGKRSSSSIAEETNRDDEREVAMVSSLEDHPETLQLSPGGHTSDPPPEARHKMGGSPFSSASSADGRTDRSSSPGELDLGEPKPGVVQTPYEDSPPAYCEPWWKPLPKWAFLRSSTSLPIYHCGPDDFLHGRSSLRYGASVDEEADSEDSEDNWWED
ncbi:hypothetical protein VSDG_09127 [Cytospora chrysosperma]|uniref:Uncharacterized protein n=1 Tax=Cytospora chrysosperma TaxID=252740 RepID=A0A423VCD7_CYTCH|nr:hypothetical protein VSDG_09127 [Valsa sordida]